MLARLQRRNRGVGVLVPHRADGNRVDLVGEHFAVVAIRLLDGELFGLLRQPVRRARAQRGKFQVRNADDGPAVDFAEPALAR